MNMPGNVYQYSSDYIPLHDTEGKRTSYHDFRRLDVYHRLTLQLRFCSMWHKPSPGAQLGDKYHGGDKYHDPVLDTPTHLQSHSMPFIQ